MRIENGFSLFTNFFCCVWFSRRFVLLFLFFRRWGFVRRGCASADVLLVVQSVIVGLWESTL